MTGPKYIFTIDLGTSGPKVALISTTGAVIHHAFEPNDYIQLPGHGVEQNPEMWWETIKTATRRMLDRQPIPLEQIAAVCCTGQWSGTVAVNQHGDYLMNALIWMDARGAISIHPYISGRVAVAGYDVRRLIKWLRITGGIPQHSGKDSISHILYIKHQHPDIYRQTYKFMEPKDYLNFRFTGKFAASYESITLHWVTDNRDLARVDYHPDLLRMVGIERDKLPELKGATEVLGPIQPDVAREFGLPEGIPVMMGTPDFHSAALGSGAVRDFEAHVYIGTSSWVSCHIPFKKTDVFHNIASLPSAIPNRYLVACEQEIAGGCLNFLKNLILLNDSELSWGDASGNIYQRFDQFAASVPAGSEGLIFTPWLNGERSPIDDHTVRGGFHNLSLKHNHAHLIRSVLEGVAYNLRWLLTYVEKFAGRQMSPLNMIGGGAKSALWCQILADMLDRPIRQVKDPVHANARGTAILAAVGLGHTTFEEYANSIEIAQTYQPNPQHRAVYDGFYREFRNIYQHNRKIYARLNRK